MNNKLPSSVNNAIQRFSKLVFAYSNRLHFIEANCTLKLKSTNSQTLDGEISPDDHFERILRSIVGTQRQLCNTSAEVERNDEQDCIQIRERPPFPVLGFLFMEFFTYFGPTVVCLFAATEVIHKGVRHINIQGPSPVGFRSLIGNYFFSTDYTMWHVARKFIVRVFILPIPFLVPAIFTDTLYRTSVKEGTYLFRPFLMLCYGCYTIQAFYFEFIKRKVNLKICPEGGGLPCTVAQNYRLKSFGRYDVPKKTIRNCTHRELPQQMLMHVHLIVLLIAFWGHAVWRLCTFLNKTLQTCLITGLSFEISVSSFREKLTFSVGLLFVSAACLWGLYLMSYLGYTMLFLFLIMVVSYSCFVFTLTTIIQCTSYDLWQSLQFLYRYLPPAVSLVVFVIVVLLDICVCCLAAVGVTNILMYAAVGIMIFLQLAVTFVLSLENLPCVACCVLISYYLWSSYRSFTKSYEDLSLKLFELHDQSKYGQLHTTRNPNLIMLGITPDHGIFNEVVTQKSKFFQHLPDCLRDIWRPCNTPDNVKRIPKELFEMACEKLMPFRKGICITLLKAALSVIFVFFVFSFTMHMKASPVLTTLVTLVAGSFPKIVIIYINRWRKRSFKAGIEEKAQEIVQEYINIRCPFNQGVTSHDFSASQVKPEHFLRAYTAILISLIPSLSLLILFMSRDLFF